MAKKKLYRKNKPGKGDQRYIAEECMWKRDKAVILITMV